MQEKGQAPVVWLGVGMVNFCCRKILKLRYFPILDRTRRGSSPSRWKAAAVERRRHTLSGWISISPSSMVGSFESVFLPICPLLVASDWSKGNSFRSNPRARTTPLMMCTLVLYTRCYRGPQHSFWNGHHGATAPDRTCGHLVGVGVQTVARSERGKIPLDSIHHLVCC